MIKPNTNAVLKYVNPVNREKAKEEVEKVNNYIDFLDKKIDSIAEELDEYLELKGVE